MAHLALALLGPPQVTLDGRPVSGFDYDKVRALLSYLAVEADRPHRRDALAALLWPDQLDQPAHNSLRQALATLRRAIGDEAAAVPFLQITREAIQFNSASDHDLDVAAFSALLATCERHPHRHPETCSSCARRLQEAITLYRGDFLAQFSLSDSIPFEEWSLVKREQLHGLMLQALIHLADYHERRGAHDEVRRYAQRLLELDPWNEAAHRQVMHAFALTGQRSAALHQYASCRRVLADELGVEPEADTTALYEQIKRGTGRAAGRAERPPTNLPAHIPLTPFVGREGELTQIADRIEHRDCRLLTLVGPGGIGKTRLALQAAQEQLTSFSDGVYFVPLAPLSSAEFLIPTIANALAFVFHGPQDPKTQLLAYLREKDMLLMLDNFEHLLDGADVLIDILRGAPAVTLLVTSRASLNLRAEWLLDIPGLAFPQSLAVTNIETYSAVRLFIQTARQARASLPLSSATLTSIARICQLVEGMPLAIEIAAAWIRVRTCAEIAQAIEHGLDDMATAMRDIPERHRSIRAVFDHSWCLLSEHERRVLAAISVFQGGFQHEAAKQVAEATESILTALVNKSLLRRNPVGRYNLHELVRQYAQEKLQAGGGLKNMHDQHLLYFLALGVATERELNSAGQKRALDRLEIEHDNLRAALRWARDQEDVKTSVLLAGALVWFWAMRGHVSEGRTWLASLLEYSRREAESVQAKAFVAAGTLAWIQSDYESGIALLQESLAMSQMLGDKRGVAEALKSLGAALWWRGDIGGATAVCRRSLEVCRDLGDTTGSGWALYYLGLAAQQDGDKDRAMELLGESLHLHEVQGDRWAMAWVHLGLGSLMGIQGNYKRAGILLAKSFALFQGLGDLHSMAWVLDNMGTIALAQKNYERAAELHRKSLTLFQQTGNKSNSAYQLGILGQIEQTHGDVKRAAASFKQSLAMFYELGEKQRVADCIERLAELCGKQGRSEQAARLLGLVEMLRETIGIVHIADHYAAYDHYVAILKAQLGEAIFTAAWAAGRTMSVEEALAEALGDE